MKKINFPRIVWVSSIFIVLIIILYLVMTYKINYEYLSHDYLYFFECEENLCVSEVKENNKLIYSKYDCGYEMCPQYIKQIDNSNYVILLKDNKYILYDYKNASIICDKYSDYKLFNDNYLIVSLNNKKGIINFNNDVILDVIYDDIGYMDGEYLKGYNIHHVIVKKYDLYGIVSYKDGKVIEDIKYSENEIDILLEKIKNS